MEDAMVINRASFQRGFAHGTVIKVERYFFLFISTLLISEFFRLDLVSDKEKKTVFRRNPTNPVPTVDKDGLPITGRRYLKGFGIFFKDRDDFIRFSKSIYHFFIRLLEKSYFTLQYSNF